MKQIIDFYFATHYVVYRYYIRKDFGPLLSLIPACAILLCLFGLLLMEVICLPCLFTNNPIMIDKPIELFYFCAGWAIEYLILYRNGTYIDVFLEYDRLANTPAMKEKLRYAKIFNICLLAFDVLGLCIADYINHHQ